MHQPQAPPTPEEISAAKERLKNEFRKEFVREQAQESTRKRLKILRGALGGSAVIGACVGTYILVLGAFTWVRNGLFGKPD